jgi:hypothetical protein
MLSQANGLETAALQSMLSSVLNENLRRIEWKGKFRELSREEVKILRLFAAKGYRKAADILEKRVCGSKSRINLPPVVVRSVKSFKSEERLGGNSAKAPSRQSDRNALVSRKTEHDLDR